MDEVISEALTNTKITILDVPMLISTLYKTYCKVANIDMVFLIEENEIVNERLTKRGGKIHNSEVRGERIKSLAKKYASFIGNYEKVLAYLRQI